MGLLLFGFHGDYVIYLQELWKPHLTLDAGREVPSKLLRPNRGPLVWAPSLESLYTHYTPYTNKGANFSPHINKKEEDKGPQLGPIVGILENQALRVFLWALLNFLWAPLILVGSVLWAPILYMVCTWYILGSCLRAHTKGP